MTDGTSGGLRVGDGVGDGTGGSASGSGDDEQDRNRWTVVFALAMDGALTVAKLIGFLVTRSSSMLAETFHSGGETANQWLLLWGRRRAEQTPPDRQHPFGYARERYFWPFIVSILIFGIGSLGSLWHAGTKLLHPEDLQDPVWAFVILGAALVFDGASWSNAIRQARQEKRGSYWQYVRRARAPEIPMILLEDTAAVVGALIAMIGVSLAVATGDPLYDALGSLAIGLLLAAVAWVLAREMKSLLIGEAALPEEEEVIRDVLEGADAVDGIVSLRTLYLGPDDLLVEAKVEMPDDLDARAVALAIDGIESGIRDRIGHVGIIAIEPDVPRSDDPDIPPWVRRSRDAASGSGSG